MNLKKYFPKELALFLIIALIGISIFSFKLFGVTGLRFVFGILVMWLPFYLILSNFDLAIGEIFVFSLLLGITLFPSIVFLLGLVFSFTLSIFITFFLLIFTLLLVIKLKKKIYK